MTTRSRSVPQATGPAFDRSYLPPAQLEFVVIADTHHIVDPYMYKAEGDSVTPELTADWSGRGDVALAYARALAPALSFHVGDLQQEYPGHESFDVGRRGALRQLADSGLAMRHVAGNMDVGDKPDPTMPAGWVRQEYLDVWHEDLGPSYYSVDEGPFHFVTLNSQLLNASLPGRLAQREWLEADLEAHAGARIVMFLHIPPFLTDKDEPGLGSYDVIDEPDRSWLLGLMLRLDVEAVFCGHTHFAMFNRIGGTRIYIAPSTTTTRPGYPEALTVVPPSRGWADTAKLGFFLVRMTEDGTAVHLVRTSGRTTIPATERARIVSRISRELPGSPLGVYLRLPLARQSEGAVVYPYHVRHRVRDDHPLLACLELGLRHVRFPIHDLDSPLQRGRLAMLRDEGVALTATAIWSAGAGLPQLDTSEVDVLEIQMPGATVPPDDLCVAIRDEEAWPSLSLAPIVMSSGRTVHKRSRVGYLASELAELDGALSQRGLRVHRAVCHLDETSPTLWDDVLAFGVPLRSIEAVDLIISARAAGDAAAAALARALVAAATLPDCRLFIDPLQELDRTAEVMAGLLDRLSNPKPAFELVRTLNTVLFGVADTAGTYRAERLTWQERTVAEGLSGPRGEHWLVLPERRVDAIAALTDRWTADLPVKHIDLQRGESQGGLSLRALGDQLRDCPGGIAIISSWAP